MKKFIKKKYIVITAVFLFVGLLAFRPIDKYFEIAKSMELYAQVYREVNQNYVDDVSPSTVMKNGLDGMLKSLDPYTNYIPEDEIEDYRTQNTGQYGGIGVVSRTYKGKTIIVKYDKASPAYKAGLKIGDEIVEVDGINIQNKSTKEIDKIFKGQAGTKMSLMITRPGETTRKKFEVTRQNIKIQDVPYSGMLASEVGYIKLQGFTRTASKEVKDAFKKLKKEGMKKLVLDLRGNPGGLVIEAVNICNMFVGRGVEVVNTKGKVKDFNRGYKTMGEAMDLEIPVVLLLNGNSASASEIVAGFLQDSDRGIIIGQRSFGKGLVQIPRPLSYNSQVKITTAKYYIPSGRCIQAIDYSDHDAGALHDRMADSLKKPFKTKNGRTVYDGVGLDPDVPVKARKLALITTTLLEQGLIFDYVTAYVGKHKKIKPAKAFQLSNAEYQDFVQWLKGKQYSYTTKVEKSLKALVEKAKKEKTYSKIKAQIESVKKKMTASKAIDLTTFKAEIKQQLELEIVLRYYLEEGQIEATFERDKEVQEALKLFKNMARYRKLLAGK
ncbi:S41 family peptidase [uncultured Microscilla sp.]|uniref:S41 family peptidase n=1 Tax=uncultured Microscilla sp. TaxID=432653 RepID=UPI00260351ED|nr:S41 family peptidase [uncultured Microscilla sp.]